MDIITPLLCWDIAALKWTSYEQKFIDLKDLYDQATAHGWLTNLYPLLHIQFDALVLTNAQQQITWVSQGFEQMTEYSTNEAVGQRPNFLQGEKTCQKRTAHIRDELRKKQSVSEVLINYRKSGEEYLCELQITPLFDGKNQLSHFLAVEKELTS